ncbi:MAG: hypothetical protein HFJ24_05655 [Clostridia bacterium]|nr:hypothetical protein [Clostridia bacterium]MCI9275440.1 hypothetical protein [Clostridia bacterium]
MLSQTELEYVKGVLNAYYAKGYKYYVVHTVTEYNNEYDVCIYLSKIEIEAVTDNYFSIDKGLKVLLDSSSRTQNSYSSRDRVDGFSGNFTVDNSEFIYTNAKNEYSLTTIPVNPNITVDYSHDMTMYALCFLITIFFTYFFIRDLFIRGR